MTKYYLLSLPVMAFPYLMIAGLGCMYSNTIMECVFFSNGFLLLGALALCAVVCALFAIGVGTGLAAGGQSGACAAKLCMIVKLVQIPAYVAIFVLGVMFSITIFGVAFVVLFVLIDCAAIAMSGFMSACTLFKCCRQKLLPLGSAVAFGIGQFVFCADVVLAVIIYVNLKKETGKNVCEAV